MTSIGSGNKVLNIIGSWKSSFAAGASSSASMIMASVLAVAVALLGWEDVGVDGMASGPRRTGISLEKYPDTAPRDAPASDVWLFVAKETALRYSTSQLYYPGPRPGGYRPSFECRTESNQIPVLTMIDRSIDSNLDQERAAGKTYFSWAMDWNWVILPPVGRHPVVRTYR